MIEGKTSNVSAYEPRKSHLLRVIFALNSSVIQNIRVE
jgi:hypothetical protein